MRAAAGGPVAIGARSATNTSTVATALVAIDAEHNDVELKSIPVEEWAEKKATAGYNQAMERLAAEREETNG